MVVNTLDPCITVEFASWWSYFWIKLKYLTQYGSWSWRNVVRNHKFAFHNLLIEVFIVLASEWETPTEECKQKDSTSPDICRRSTKFFLGNNLWSHVWRSSTENFYLFVIWNASTEAKINNFDISFGIKHYIFKLDVSVAYTFAVAVLKSTDYLAIYPSSIILVHPTIWLRFQETMSGATSDIFHN